MNGIRRRRVFLYFSAPISIGTPANLLRIRCQLTSESVPKVIGFCRTQPADQNGFGGEGQSGETDESGGEGEGGKIKASFSFGDKTLNYDVNGDQEFADAITGHLNEILATAAGKNMLEAIVDIGKSLMIEYGKVHLEGGDPSGTYDSIIKYDHKTPQFIRVNTQSLPINTDPIANILAHELHHTWRRFTTVKGGWFSNNTYGSLDIGEPVPGVKDWETYAIRHTNLIRAQMGLGYKRTHYKNNLGEWRVDN